VEHDISSEQPGKRASDQYRHQLRQYRRYLLIVSLVGIAWIFFDMVKLFVIPIIMAAVFSGLFYPLKKWLCRVTHNRHSLSALLSCLILLLGIMIPSYFLGYLIAREAISFYNTVKVWVTASIIDDTFTLTSFINSSEWLRNLPVGMIEEMVQDIEWQTYLNEAITGLGGLVGTILNITSRSTLQLLADVAITFFTMFYFFRDGDRLVTYLKSISPLGDAYEDALINRFRSVTRAAIKGTMLIGLIQGTLGGLTLWLCGVSSPVLWGAVMVVLSVIPLTGTWLVLYPAAFVQLVQGYLWSGVIIMVVTIVVISNIDNLLRPRLVGRDANMHDLLIFFSTLGGITMFGIMGFILGPIIAAIFLTLLDFYTTEFKPHLELARKSSVQTTMLEPSLSPTDDEEEVDYTKESAGG
jgi:predicted PurR-regulated permease PerM